MKLRDRVVLITGGRRVGRELALLLAGRGMHVAMTYHSSQSIIETTLAEAATKGVQTLPLAADLTDAEQAISTVERTVATFGRLDVVVNMASIYRRTPFSSLRPADFDEMIAANLAAPYHVSVAAGQRMLRQSDDENGLRGKIISIGDWAVDRPYPGFLPYIIAKGGLSTLTLALAKELAPHVTVNAILPAMVEPPEAISDERLAAVLAATPMARRGYPDDVNRLIVYLLEGTDFATGGLYRVDGGRFLGNDQV